MLEKRLGKQEHVRASRAERRHRELDDVDPIVEVLAERAFFDADHEVAVRSGDQSHVKRNFLLPTDRTCRSGLDRPQKLEINNRLERPLKRPLGGHGRGGRLDKGMTPPWPQSCTKAILDEGGGTCRGTGLSGSSSLTEIGTCVPLASCSASNESLHAADNLTSPSLSSSSRHCFARKLKSVFPKISSVVSQSVSAVKFCQLDRSVKSVFFDQFDYVV